MRLIPLYFLICFLVVSLLTTRMVGSTWIYNGCYKDDMRDSGMSFVAMLDDVTPHRMTLVGCLLMTRHLNTPICGYRLDGGFCLICHDKIKIGCDYAKHGRLSEHDCTQSNMHSDYYIDDRDENSIKAMQVFTYNKDLVDDLCNASYPYDCDVMSGRKPVKTVLRSLLDTTAKDPSWPWRDKNYLSKCPALFHEVLRDRENQLTNPIMSSVPFIPDALLRDFTLNNTVNVVYWEEREADRFKVYHVNDVAVWNIQTLTKYHKQNYCFIKPPHQCGLLFNRQDIIEAYIRNKTGIIFGSQLPWVEASLLLDADAALVTTVEYFPIVIKHVSKWTALQPMQVASQYLANNFPQVDFAFSLSSFEHTGLGRYGDKLDADGDLKAMGIAHCLIKDGGILFLSLPMGQDIIYYNAHRKYGRIRLPLLFVGWEVVDVIGHFSFDTPVLTPQETSIFVLKKIGLDS
jgi:hypothetical protein